MHSGFGQAVQIEGSRNILMANNVIYNFGKYGVNISSSSNITMDGNQISVISDFQVGEAPTSEVQPAGLLSCINSDCSQITVINNVVSGVSNAGFISPGHECGASPTQQIFRNNIAHSINGYGAIMFSNQASFTQSELCVEASYFSAYKCSQGGVIIYNATLSATFSNMILIDNQIGGTIMIGHDDREYDS